MLASVRESKVLALRPRQLPGVQRSNNNTPYVLTLILSIDFISKADP